MLVANNIELHIGGVTPFTTIDFPGRMAAVIFCQGCPWHCSYCHNPHLIPPGPGQITWPDFYKWLQTRKQLLQGVVFSGGEPLLQRQLTQAIDLVHRDGFEVAIHTSGVYPKRLISVLHQVQWIGLDIKAPFDEYPSITGGPTGEHTKQSLEAILKSGVEYELRSTIDPAYFNEERAKKMAEQLAQMGAKSIVLQECRTLDEQKSQAIDENIIKAVKSYLSVTIRK